MQSHFQMENLKQISFCPKICFNRPRLKMFFWDFSKNLFEDKNVGFRDHAFMLSKYVSDLLLIYFLYKPKLVMSCKLKSHSSKPYSICEFPTLVMHDSLVLVLCILITCSLVTNWGTKDPLCTFKVLRIISYPNWNLIIFIIK